MAKNTVPTTVEFPQPGWETAVTSGEPNVEDGEQSQLLNEESFKPPRKESLWRRFRSWFIHGAFMALYLILLPSAMSLWPWHRQNCVSQFNSYSPINDGIKEEYVDNWFKGSLWYQSPYKGPPTPEVNRAWKDLMKYGVISVTAEDIQRIGHNTTAVQFPDEVGGGYLAVAMGTHHIHCLYFIWKDHHMDSFPQSKINKEEVPEMYERHYEHCVDYLRQAIMCNFDPGIIPYYWVRKHNQPTPDGNTFHKCVNWDHLQGWLKDRAVEIPDDFEWHQPPDAVPLPDNP
ncbi:unnamed protein product [Clonostachys solani]|uniref:Cyclochlorotine biosynthesis protein O n=1 Tax=Clonostachys solani TaxID=160281 RepID=A0A9P0EJ03_9HYPO|nr:unnamed protein product [Clonostachys solani]